MELLSDLVTWGELFLDHWQAGSYLCSRCSHPLYHSDDKWKVLASPLPCFLICLPFLESFSMIFRAECLLVCDGSNVDLWCMYFALVKGSLCVALFPQAR